MTATITQTFFFFEIYTNSPEGEPGWDIKVGFVKADDRATAVSKIKNRFGKKFDCIIQCYECNLCNLGCETVFIH